METPLGSWKLHEIISSFDGLHISCPALFFPHVPRWLGGGSHAGHNLWPPNAGSAGHLLASAPHLILQAGLHLDPSFVVTQCFSLYTLYTYRGW